jgi:hypothetical protein
MSTNSECHIFEYKPDQWYYLLQDWDCPHGAWDWREYASCFGPFRSQDAAIIHLDANHANPGGWWTMPHSEFKTDEVYDKAVKEARK